LCTERLSLGDFDEDHGPRPGCLSAHPREPAPFPRSTERVHSRLQRYDRLGVQATTEVQAAARRVAEQNAALRSFLNELGKSDSEIEEYLCRSSGTESSASPPQTALPAMRSEMVAPMHMSNGARVRTEVERHSAASSTPSGSYTKPTLQPNTGTSANAQLPHSGASCMQMSPAPPNGQGSRNTNTTSCEDAARIIARMRGHYNEEDVRAELGCSTNKHCTVENITIFSESEW
jgi:hypothetical protein